MYNYRQTKSMCVPKRKAHRSNDRCTSNRWIFLQHNSVSVKNSTILCKKKKPIKKWRSQGRSPSTIQLGREVEIMYKPGIKGSTTRTAALHPHPPNHTNHSKIQLPPAPNAALCQRRDKDLSGAVPAHQGLPASS